MMVLPQRGRRVLVAEPNEYLTAAGAFDVHVRRLVLTRRRVHVDPKGALVVHLDHAGS
jgi:hypothetical protein